MARGKWRPNEMAGRWNRLYPGTPAELSLEDAIAALGVPYRTQFPGFLYGSRFFPDFILPTLQLIIEVDDDSHNKTDKIIEDDYRTAALEKKYGWTVVRCTNEEALSDPFGAVQRMLMDQGVWPIPEGIRSLKVRDFLPKKEKCPPKGKKPKQGAGVERQARIVKKAKTRARRRGYVLNISSFNVKGEE